MSNLKRIRKDREISQAKLAELSGVNLKMIQKYEQGEKDINKAQGITIYKISKTLNCKMEALLEVELKIDDIVIIVDSDSEYYGAWGTIKSINGDDYYIAIRDNADTLSIFKKEQLKK